jgi:hypothetical protein
MATKGQSATEKKATYEELVMALCDSIDAYTEIDDMLVSFASCGPEGMTKNEKRRRREAEKNHDKAEAVWARANK